MKNTTRTFVAVEIDSAVRARVVELIEKLRGAPVDVKWVEAHNLHLTLQFLGEVQSREIPRVCQVVQAAAAEVARFELELRGAGAFPSANRPRTLWLGAGRGAEQMSVLHKQVETALKKLGFRPEGRRFEPHLTIGRVRSGGPGLAELGRLVQEQAAFEAGCSRINEAVVFSSQLTSSGPIYEALSRARLM
jgi:2'-5' RNA ligase